MLCKVLNRNDVSIIFYHLKNLFDILQSVFLFLHDIKNIKENYLLM